jgi:hypothetical protein
MLVSNQYTSQEPVLADSSSPVLPHWSAPAMGAPPKANQSGKPLFGNGEHLATVGQYWLYMYYIIMFPWYFSTAGPGPETPIRLIESKSCLKASLVHSKSCFKDRQTVF